MVTFFPTFASKNKHIILLRAYALRGLEYYYGEDTSFTTEGTSGGRRGCGTSVRAVRPASQN